MTMSDFPEPGLTREQVAQFWEQGFVSGIPILTEKQTETARLRFEALEQEAMKEAGDAWTSYDYEPWNEKTCGLRAWFHAMSTHPRILAAVSSILGPDLLIRNADVFIKPPGNSREISWHVDTTAPQSEAQYMVTAWLGMSESTTSNGSMEFIPQSHLFPLSENNKDKSSLSFSGEALHAIKGLPQEANLMRPGQLSIHGFRTLHRSGGNHTSIHRFGYVTRFMSPKVTPKAAECGQAYLAQGKNEPANLQLQPHFPTSWYRSKPD